MGYCEQYAQLFVINIGLVAPGLVTTHATLQASSEPSGAHKVMSSSSLRSFYDLKQPRLLSEDEIAQLSPAECDAACLQVDQILVNILQNIDADFGKSHRIITDKILPDLERYGEASKGIWEGLKFWQGFFEASANVKLSENSEESEVASTAVDRSHQSADNSMETVQPNDEADHHSRAEFTAPDSPFENLKEDLRQNLGIPSKSGSAPDAPAAQQADDSQQTGSSGSLRRPPHWHDLSIDSPDTTLQMPVPKDLSMLIDGQSGVSLDSDISMASFGTNEQDAHEQETSKANSSQSHTRKSVGRGSKILLHQALLRDTMSGNHKRQTISTPAKARSRRGSTIASLPPEAADPEWDGIADLRKVPLDGFAGSSKMTSRPPPLEPPSVLREWKQRGYESMFQSRADDEAQASTSKLISSASERVSDAGPSRDVSVSRALIDLREGDTASSRGSTQNSQRPQRDDPFNEPSTIKARPGRASALGGPSSRGQQLRMMPIDNSMDSPPDSPTLFGIRHDPKPSLRPSQQSGPTDPNRPNNPRPTSSQTFVPMRPDEIDTFFGGNLLESECFEPSPLQAQLFVNLIELFLSTLTLL
ncbi:hypothetical protein PtA15_8A507 [Puccinia triticina]|uniref:DASH complex subunit ASK1 n=1 Tax=Puccinia triticina TaxID=208348 RepID=A0ABY7CRP2_9BASI|nr:uncharacterized protein PtA15_8A507 [Puccinia triticina]WAQ87603.1 hypothetical protein PtA15_8A507 [Puccinia triticina]WAR57453.1 hypothetical protein PtB15_8B500 [Puccinia triticina]